MSSVVPTAPIERVTVPLQPRTAGGCCDLAVMFYGRYVGPLMRLYLAIATPVVVFVYGVGRFAGSDLTLPLIVAIVASKPLGALTIAATARSTFGESFERRGDGPPATPRLGLLRDVSRSVLTAGAVLAGIAFVAAVVDDAWGTGRVVAFGTNAAATMVSLVTAVLALRSGVWIAERHSPERTVAAGMAMGLLLRLVFAAPLGTLFFESTRTAGYFLLFLWLPVAAVVAFRRSFGSERRSLSSIDAALYTRQSDKALEYAEIAGPAVAVASFAGLITIVALSAIELALTTAGLPGPISGPVGDSFDPDVFELGVAWAALGRSPLLAASLLAAALFAYQLTRIAWYFVYIDARVRRDCWDMELLLAREAKRLDGN